MKSLIVEDDFTSRLLLQTFLARYGECHTAANGEEALSAFGTVLSQASDYDLVCVDIMMPGLNGKEVVKHLRDMEEKRGILSTRGVKIIMTTGVNDTKEVFHSFKLLCDAYMTKPIDMGMLLSHLKAFQLVD